jgi:hypothetical protein
MAYGFRHTLQCGCILYEKLLLPLMLAGLLIWLYLFRYLWFIYRYI